MLPTAHAGVHPQPMIILTFPWRGRGHWRTARGSGKIWPLSIIMRALTSREPSESFALRCDADRHQRWNGLYAMSPSMPTTPAITRARGLPGAILFLVTL